MKLILPNIKTFNRTNFGIENLQIQSHIKTYKYLSIVPILELKKINPFSVLFQPCTFNRTNFGIENVEGTAVAALHQLLIVPILELKIECLIRNHHCSRF